MYLRRRNLPFFGALMLFALIHGPVPAWSQVASSKETLLTSGQCVDSGLLPGHSEPLPLPRFPESSSPLLSPDSAPVKSAPSNRRLAGLFRSQPNKNVATYPPVFEQVLKQDPCSCNECEQVENWSCLAPWFGLPDHRGPEPGIGHERVMFAPFEIDTSQPYNYTLIRLDSGFGLHNPDRAEYFWSKPGVGPAIGNSPSNSPDRVNFQELRFVTEAATKNFSVMTDIPLRFIESPGNFTTSGLGDMRVATKARLINGERWQLTQIFRTWINTGSGSRGLGAGHVSLEPGLLARYQWTPETFFHGELKYLFPISADPGFSSNVFTYGVGVSHVFFETDHYAVIPDLEMVNYNFMNGQQTAGGFAAPVNGQTAVNFVQGVRIVLGPPGDLGLFEVGVSHISGFGDRFCNDMLRLDFKFIY